MGRLWPLSYAFKGPSDDAPVHRYAHNALGQRLFKTQRQLSPVQGDEADPGFWQGLMAFFSRLWSPQTQAVDVQGTSYVYDEDGTLLAELATHPDPQTASSVHYLWLPTHNGPMPIAALHNSTASPQRFYAVHADHLNTPRRLTQADGRVAWQWAYSAFGEEEPTLGARRYTNSATVPTTGSTSIPEIAFNLRYPGQYFDRESGLNYNYFRSYNPQTGRYSQADPIGLEAEWNRFGYVSGNLLSMTDPLGLMGRGSGSGTTNAYPPGDGLGAPFGQLGSAIGGAMDFGRSFGNMMDATYWTGRSHKGWANQDKYFHCVANCEAAQRGSGGHAMACLISDSREWFDQKIKGDPPAASAADQIANTFGRSQGRANPVGSCRQSCGSYRPGGSFPF